MAAIRASGAPLDVTAGGRHLQLHEFTEGSFGLFEVARPVRIEIRADFNVRWVDVRPLSLGIRATIAPDHSTVTFTLPSPSPVTVEFNDDLTHVLHLLAYAPDLGTPHEGDPGVRYFGPGFHNAGMIDLHDHETLYLAPGAWVRGSVRSVGTTGVSIRGRGVLDGTSLTAAPSQAAQSSTPSAVRAEDYGMGRRNLIYLFHTKGAKIEGITLFGSSGWTVVLRQADGTQVDGIRILNPSENYGDDGIDVVSSSGVAIRNAFIRTNDDCIAVKNLDDVPMRDVSASGCVIWNMPTGGNALEVGFELGSAPVTNISFSNMDIIHVERGAALSIHQGDSGLVDDVSYDDIRVEDVRRKLFDFAVLYAAYGLDKPATPADLARRRDTGGVWDGELRLTPSEHAALAPGRGRITNVRIHNLSVVSGALPYSIVSGYDAGHPVSDVHVDGLSYLGRRITSPAEAKIVLEDAPGFEFH
jgi:polygalacturonase